MSHPADRSKAYRGAILHFVSPPQEQSPLTEGLGPPQDEYFEDGILWIRDGKVERVGPATKLLKEIPKTVEITHYKDCLISPGFIDTHTHFAQTEIIASPASDTLHWLERYTFPTELKFSDRTHSQTIAGIFLDELLKRGTTTALVFGTVHPNSVDTFFEEALKRKMRMICGKVLMDRNAPEALRDSPQIAYQDSKALIKKWQGKERLEYAITPRFAPTSSPEQLKIVEQLLDEHPELVLQTHLSETPNEVAWVKELFPNFRSYLAVYEHFGMCRPRSLFAHAIHLEEEDWSVLAKSGSSVAFCPTSNLFLGSGLFNLSKANTHQVNVTLGTDVGGGTSFSMLRTMSEAQKICALRGQPFSAMTAWYLATLGAATSLRLDRQIGNFSEGKEADFVVFNLTVPSLLKLRLDNAKSLEEKLFALITLNEESTVQAAYILGECVFHQP